MYKYIYKYRVKMKLPQNVYQWMFLIPKKKKKKDLMTTYAHSLLSSTNLSFEMFDTWEYAK